MNAWGDGFWGMGAWGGNLLTGMVTARLRIIPLLTAHLKGDTDGD